jgi:hypothetical protein
VTATVRPGLLWFGVLAAPLAWVVQLVAGYGLEEAACASDLSSSPVLDVDSEPAIAVVSAVALAVAAAGGLAALAGLLSVRSDPGADPRGRLAFMGVFGLLASGVFLAVIALGAVALLSLDVCAPG